MTPDGLGSFSQKVNRDFVGRLGRANSPLGLYLDVDFELVQAKPIPSKHWFNLYPGPSVDWDLLRKESRYYNNLIEDYEMELRVIKNTGL